MILYTQNIRPSFVKEGDLVGITAPAGIVKTEDVEPAVEILLQWGLNVVKGKYLYEKHNFFAGTDEQRLEDFQNMLDNPAIRVIFCARGGYGVIRILEKLDFTKFLISPKWIVGYSDITLIHLYFLKKLRCESLHAIMPKNFKKGLEDGLSLKYLKDVLFGESILYSVEINSLNRLGSASGTLTGGNLSIISSLQATKYEMETRGKILFIEDVGEYIYRIERMIINMKMSGKLSQLKGLIVGGMTDIKNTIPEYGKTAYEIIAEAVEEFDYPVIYDFPAGHKFPNVPLIMGRKVEMNVSEKEVKILFRSSL